MRLSLEGGGGECGSLTYRRNAGRETAVEYRVLPKGEIAQRAGLGRYAWKDSATGKILKTEPKRKPLRSDRVMPGQVKCGYCHAALLQIAGPWKIRNGQGWRAQCSRCKKLSYVQSDGSSRFFKDTRFRHRHGGGVKPTKTAVFANGMELRAKGYSWGKIAVALDPQGFQQNQKAASDRIRAGVTALKNKLDQ